ELGFRTKTDDSVEMLNGLYRILMREYKEGNMVLLIVDEAQNMPMQTLENLRMLSNFETSKDKLLQIVMIGQCEFEQMLNQYSLRQLKERIAIRCSIAPFTKKESVAYIKHRLEKASENNNQVFTKEALKAIIKEAKGIPRHLNILCDNALITGFRNQKNPVNLKIVKDVIGDFKGKEKSSFPKWMLASAILLILIAYVTLILAYKDLILSGARVLGLALVRLFLHSIFYTLTLP
ncbi:MAG TPA: AAA family ATPase, partial [Thermodesulfobacteriota bacterium]|nr:AAA family ATPase [Thermodesulfobacteriota bacterium]